jgi:hypothetical protein
VEFLEARVRPQDPIRPHDALLDTVGCDAQSFGSLAARQPIDDGVDQHGGAPSWQPQEELLQSFLAFASNQGARRIRIASG